MQLYSNKIRDGFGKFQENCQKVHNNEVCSNMQDYKSVQCTKRHPKVCKNFKNPGYCRHKKECSYRHVPQLEGEKLNDPDTTSCSVY